MDSTTDITKKPLMGTLVAVGVFLAVAFGAAWAVSKGWQSGKG